MELRITKDPMANAGYIALSPAPRGGVSRTLPVRDGDDIVATLDFDAEGCLLGIELLDATRQMARIDAQ